MLNSNLIDFKIISSNAKDSDYQRLIDINSQVINFVNTHNPSLIVIEGLAFRSIGSKAKTLAGLHYLVACELISLQYEVKIVYPSTLKKYATGRGNASKTDMINATPREILDQFKCKKIDDLVDAYWLAKMGE